MIVIQVSFVCGKNSDILLFMRVDTLQNLGIVDSLRFDCNGT